MTRAEQNQIILARLAGKLKDQPNANKIIEDTFAAWFQNLAQQGLAQMSAAEAQPSGGGESGGEGESAE